MLGGCLRKHEKTRRQLKASNIFTWDISKITEHDQKNTSHNSKASVARKRFTVWSEDVKIPSFKAAIINYFKQRGKNINTFDYHHFNIADTFKRVIQASLDHFW